MKIFLSIALIVLVLVLACGDTPTDSPPEEPPATYTGIIFARYNSINTKSVLCRINPNGTGLDSLTDTTNFKMMPAISPDGTRIVYSAGDMTDSDLYLMTINDSVVVRLTNLTGRVTEPAFSPDGTRILFTAALVDSFLDTANIYVVNTDGTGIEMVASAASGYRSPVWSPTSSDSIYFLGGGGLLHMMNLADRGTDLPIALGRLSPSNLTFSPTDSTFLVDADVDLSPDSIHWHIHRGDFSGARPVDISDPDMYDMSPAWSPDGSQFVFRTHGFYLHEYDDALLIADADGSNRTAIPGTDTRDHDPVWSPIN